MKTTPVYSGKLSRRFWHRVNRLPETRKRECYIAGVLLQNMEGDVLRLLDNNETLTRMDKRHAKRLTKRP